MITQDMVPQLRRAEVIDPNGEKIGTVGQVWLRDGSHEPTWVSVRTGLFGMRETFVPLQGAEASADNVHVVVRKDQVRDAPRVVADGSLPTVQERQLYEHYGLSPDAASTTTRSDLRTAGRNGADRTAADTNAGADTAPDATAGTTAGAAGLDGAGVAEAASRNGHARGRTAEPTEADLTGEPTGTGWPGAATDAPTGQATDPSTDTATETPADYPVDLPGEAQGITGAGAGTAATDESAERALIRSEERLRIATERVEAGRARLRKYVVTEEQQVSVPVRREQIRVEREPISETEAGRLDEPVIEEDAWEITLHAERPVVHKETVPVERVRLTTETIREEQVVRDRIRKEQIDIDHGNPEGGAGR